VAVVTSSLEQIRVMVGNNPDILSII